MAINEQLKNSITNTLSQLSYSGQDYIEEAREAVRRADYQVAAEILRSHGHEFVPDPRADIIRFNYGMTDRNESDYPMPPTGRFAFLPEGILLFAGTPEELLAPYFGGEQSEGLASEIVAAALAWREADETNASQRCEELIAACDSYVEAKEK